MTSSPIDRTESEGEFGSTTRTTNRATKKDRGGRNDDAAAINPDHHSIADGSNAEQIMPVLKKRKPVKELFREPILSEDI